jgi:hypothetical protein
LRATLDLLEPGGRLALAVWATADRNPWLSLVFDAVMTTLGASPPEPGTPGPFTMGDPERVRALLGEAGFADVVVDEVGDVRTYASPAEWWSRMFDSSAGPIARILQTLPAEQAEQVRERATAGAERFVEGGELRLPAALVVALARRPA